MKSSSKWQVCVSDDYQNAQLWFSSGFVGDWMGSARNPLLPANLHPSLTWAAGEGERRPPASLHHYDSSRGQNSLPSIPPPAPKLPSQNDQLPELGATGRNRKIRPTDGYLTHRRGGKETTAELSLVVFVLVVSPGSRQAVIKSSN